MCATAAYSPVDYPCSHHGILEINTKNKHYFIYCKPLGKNSEKKSDKTIEKTLFSWSALELQLRVKLA